MTKHDVVLDRLGLHFGHLFSLQSPQSLREVLWGGHDGPVSQRCCCHLLGDVLREDWLLLLRFLFHGFVLVRLGLRLSLRFMQSLPHFRGYRRKSRCFSFSRPSKILFCGAFPGKSTLTIFSVGRGLGHSELLWDVKKHDPELGRDQATGPAPLVARLFLLRDLPLEQPVDAWEVVCADVGEQNGVDPVQVAHQLPEARLPIGASVHQDVESVDGEQSGVPSAPGEDVAAGFGQLQETPRGRGLQELKGRRHIHRLRDVLAELRDSLHLGQQEVVSPLGALAAQDQQLLPGGVGDEGADLGQAKSNRL
ncbi:hypothetical protein EYF80_056664 [Liparis tanakae]|uniref:Uncharacterized protein n=1 Tax=Liparis tanakae TaxID=230148 RepID=A0A4Z2EY93_9TELE|nr:hypothetical protein EYF80_056664 [Liparis tanakae]